MNFVRSSNISLKYQRIAPSCCKAIGIRKFELVAKTQFLCLEISFYSVRKRVVAKKLKGHMMNITKAFYFFFPIDISVKPKSQFFSFLVLQYHGVDWRAYV